MRPRSGPLRPLGLPALLSTLALIGVLTAFGCGSNDGRPSSGAGTSDPRAIQVVATTALVGDLVRDVGGSAVDVAQLLTPNTDPHDYEPRPNDVRATTAARLVFRSGGDLDVWIRSIIDQAGSSATIVDLGAQAATSLPGESTGADKSEHDPHWWHDPRNVAAAARTIRDALVKANPNAKATYRARARAYVAKLRTLDAGIKACFDAVPVAQRKLVTDHDAFGYFARRYDIAVIGAVIPAQTTNAQPSAGDIAALSRVIKREGVKAIFSESSVNAKLAEAIARQTGASADYALYGDTLGPPGSGADTYIGMQRRNADTMVRGFTEDERRCEIPGF